MLGEPWPRLRLPKLTDEAVALVLSSCGVPGQCARLDLAKGLKHAFDVVIREILVHGSHVDTVEGSCLLSQLVYDGLCLPYVAGPAHLEERQGTKSSSQPGLATVGFRRVTRQSAQAPLRPHLNVPASQHHRVHLLQGQLSGFGDLILHKGEALDTGKRREARRTQGRGGG